MSSATPSIQKQTNQNLIKRYNRLQMKYKNMLNQYQQTNIELYQIRKDFQKIRNQNDFLIIPTEIRFHDEDNWASFGNHKV